MQVRIIRSSRVDVKVGNSTKIEPSVNPIIPANVILWNLSKRNFVNFIKTKQPITNPIPIGINTLKDSVEIPVKYIEYTPSSIKMIVLLTPRNNNSNRHKKAR